MTDTPVYKLIEQARRRGLSCDLNSPASQSQIQRFLDEFSTSLTQYAMVLQIHNGLNVAGMRLLSVSECHWMDVGIVAVQNWGNGDFDAVITNPDENGTVWFCNHAPDVRVKIANSVDEWLATLALEVEQVGFIRHPRDYAAIVARRGAYSKVLESLASTNCELTRWLKRASER